MPQMVTWNDRETGQPRSAPKVIADQLAIVKPYSVRLAWPDAINESDHHTMPSGPNPAPHTDTRLARFHFGMLVPHVMGIHTEPRMSLQAHVTFDCGLDM